ncbi:hypothetical protein P731_14285 [Listeria monocytogenes SHL014]|nr:hypothetical protein P732_06610 [Listeria monocytogenes SHL015]PIL08348.1 hypothetical protein P731_14285 [Listeria monocytogenes SHL014]PIL09243.1 hypothetical protein P733_14600 [Listeria monocytogenes SHL016]PIL11487.1 hypothetical protein P734_11260 [Listeria monocytogenes SHL017]PIL17395.1 hypothetical protein P736_13890 [Listeria monocytogenes SHL018]
MDLFIILFFVSLMSMITGYWLRGSDKRG